MSDKEEIEISIEQKLAFDLANYTNKNLFITGKAGTGKTTFLKNLKNLSVKNTIVLAPTGVAAINAGGVTIHSMFLLPLVSFVPSDQMIDRNIAITKSETFKHFKFNKEKRKLLSELDMLIIDEISMVRCDLLDAVNWALQSVKRNALPFGGVQVVMIGDMYQLPPVVKEDQWKILSQYYKSPYFFDSQVLNNTPPVCIEFKKVYRQQDKKFINLLNAIRFQEYDDIDFELLHEQYQPDFEPKPGYITLTTHNYIADEINKKELDKLKEEFFYFPAKVEGLFSDNAFPTDYELALKKGTQVMFIKNDSSGAKRYFNGKIGIIEETDDFDIFVKFENEDNLFKLEHETWNNIKYTLDKETNKIKEEELGSFSQFPIRLAWAVTIHKSQGLTFDKAIIDAGKSFASGQVYVALSRCRTLEGIVLKSKINNYNIIQDNKINEFQDQMWNSIELENLLESEKYNYALERLFKLLEFKFIRYEVIDWKEAVVDKNIPEKEAVLEMVKQISDDLLQLQYTSDKFRKNVEEWFQNSNVDFEKTWDKILKRSSDAVEYFSQQLYDNVWIKIKNHYSEYKNKSRIKQYLKSVEELQKNIQVKIEQILKIEMIDQPLSEKTFDFSISKKEKEKEKKVNTYEITYELLQQGKSIEEIAKERNLVETTIQGHIAKLIEEKKLNTFDYISEERFEFIKQKIQKLSVSGFKEIKDNLGEEYFYFEIKIVSNALKN